jgi:putative redox protein
MPSELHVSAVNHGEMRISASAREHVISMDYPISSGTDITPLETLLASLAACSGNSLAFLLRKSQQPLDGVEVNVHGHRRDEHPTILTDIELEFVVHGTEVEPAAVERAIKMSEEHLCPVWCMLKDGTSITSSFTIVA